MTVSMWNDGFIFLLWHSHCLLAFPDHLVIMIVGTINAQFDGGCWSAVPEQTIGYYWHTKHARATGLV